MCFLRIAIWDTADSSAFAQLFAVALTGFSFQSVGFAWTGLVSCFDESEGCLSALRV